jgi:serine/threonine protein kinase
MAVDPARVKALFLAASDLADPAERAAYLDRECAGMADLRARVEALLGANDGAPLPEPGPAGATDTFAPDAPAPAPTTGTFAPDTPGSAHTADWAERHERVGTAIASKYTLVEVIGEGGMGSVWRAQQTEPVKRFVAVKLIKAGMDSRQVLARFEAERQALALMDHPNIAKVLDGGLNDGRPFFVMELVKGVPITEYCDTHKLTPKERLELFVPVCQAIQHAHQKGIIHRDIKPSNVLVSLFDDKPVPKVIDFGVAKAMGQPLTEKTLATGFGAVVGTPEYMSPEQANFNNPDIDTRSDVYALGVLLYELLAGSPPFSRRELEKSGALEIFRVIREQEPPRPSMKLSSAAALPALSANRKTEPKRLTALLRGELDWIVMKALEKDRARRYDTANAFAADVQRYLDAEPVHAHPPSTAYRVSKALKRNRGLVLAVGTVFLALVGGLIGTRWQAVRADEARETAQGNAVRADRECALAELRRVEAESATRSAVAAEAGLKVAFDGAVDDLLGTGLLKFGSLDREPIAPNERLFLDRVLTYYQERLVTARGDERAELLLRIGLVRGRLRDAERMEEAFAEALGIWKALVTADARGALAYQRKIAAGYAKLERLYFFRPDAGEYWRREKELLKLAVESWQQITAQTTDPSDYAQLARTMLEYARRVRTAPPPQLMIVVGDPAQGILLDAHRHVAEGVARFASDRELRHVQYELDEQLLANISLNPTIQPGSGEPFVYAALLRAVRTALAFPDQLIPPEGRKAGYDPYPNRPMTYDARVERLVEKLTTTSWNRLFTNVVTPGRVNTFVAAGEMWNRISVAVPEYRYRKAILVKLHMLEARAVLNERAPQGPPLPRAKQLFARALELAGEPDCVAPPVHERVGETVVVSERPCTQACWADWLSGVQFDGRGTGKPDDSFVTELDRSLATVHSEFGSKMCEPMKLSVRSAHLHYAEWLLKRGRAADAEHHAARAEKVALSMAVDPPENGFWYAFHQLQFDLGSAASTRNDVPGALARLDRVVRYREEELAKPRFGLFPKEGRLVGAARAYLARADVYRSAGRFDEALGDYGTVIRLLDQRELVPANDRSQSEYYAPAHFRMALCLLRTGKVAEADRSFKTAIELRTADPFQIRPKPNGPGWETVTIYYDCGLAYVEAKQWEKGLEALGKAQELMKEFDQRFDSMTKPKRSWGHRLSARAFMALKKHDAALAEWERALPLAPAPELHAFRLECAAHLLEAGRHESIAVLAARMAADGKFDANRTYDAACLYALAAQTAKDESRRKFGDDAMGALKRAGALGYRDFAHMKRDPDLDALRDRTDFKQFLAELEGTSGQKLDVAPPPRPAK